MCPKTEFAIWHFHSFIHSFIHSSFIIHSFIHRQVCHYLEGWLIWLMLTMVKVLFYCCLDVWRSQLDSFTLLCELLKNKTVIFHIVSIFNYKVKAPRGGSESQFQHFRTSETFDKLHKGHQICTWFEAKNESNVCWNVKLSGCDLISRAPVLPTPCLSFQIGYHWEWYWYSSEKIYVLVF